MQADIWAKRSEAGDIYELDPLVVEEATCTRTAFSTLVDGLAHQGHLPCTSQQRSAMQSLQYVQGIQAILIFEQSPLCATAKRSSARQQETRVTFSTNLAHATKRPANTTRKNSCIVLLWVIGTSSAHTVTRNITLCLLLLSLNLISARVHQCCD